MNLLAHFLGQRFDLSSVASQFEKQHREDYEINITCDAARIETDDFNSALTIGTFVLNLLPRQQVLSETELEYYINSHFLRENHKYYLSCNQNFLQIRRKIL